MLTKEDLKLIRGVVSEEMSQTEVRLDKRFTKSMAIETESLEKRLTSRAVAEVSSLEKRITKNIVSEVVPRVVSEVTSIVGEMIENNILPQFEEIRRDIRFIKAQMVTRFDLEDRLADFKLSLKGSLL